MLYKNYRSKELSWLYFNARVLQEAAKNDVPLIERIKFLGIYSNNLDEFFRVRVALLKRLSQLGKDTEIDGISPRRTLLEINRIVKEQGVEFNRVYERIIKELEEHNIFVLDENSLNEQQGAYVRRIFEQKVRPKLMPVIISKRRNLPDLKDDAIYLGVILRNYRSGKSIYALLELPVDAVGRFFIVPSNEHSTSIMLLDDVIRFELGDIFYMFDFDEIGAYTFKLTRDAELDIDDDIAESYVSAVSQSLEKRKDAPPVRFVYDKEMPEDLLEILLRKLHFTKDDVIIKGGRYHNFKDFMDFPKIGGPGMMYEPLPPIRHEHYPNGKSVFPVLQQRDILLHFPYHSFLHFIDFLREASIDPLVKELKITIYRVAKHSNVMDALINAARNGKKVTAILELQARFDELPNIKWANKLQNAGVKVIYGVKGLKVHSKLCLVTRKEDRKLRHYACIGTGNFNEDTARVFSDHLLMTAHEGIAKEVAAVFDFFDRNYRISRYSHLWVSPFYFRRKLTELINKEIKVAKEGGEARLWFKLNNLADYRMIQKLYQAKRAGVDVRLNVRGMFSMLPQFDKNVEPIPCIGLIDRFLEHSRFFIIGYGDREKVYIASADLMTRNLDRRVEVACPVYDGGLKKQLIDMFLIQWKDTSAARILDNELNNQIKKPDKGESPFRSQIEFYKYLGCINQSVLMEKKNIGQ
ncbi:polyphosphate kinase 1 [Thermophagus xiamenensis]|uniref:Polyphosphate kinase n=1 Tax=Thermophagus xiamenensis TaxID=385682 RepID=A0A1I2AZI1_9BACT|nr:polyphosphate kinase 1 [Thermophagus xiamenensis]SFE48320.1 polyphosphate kinase [Thermophagus xiamenensis]